ncbi:MAG: regulatory protein RecX [Eubacteriales bacterium]|nr:regulatory protein RecX [Eubacteriales bacterium]
MKVWPAEQYRSESEERMTADRKIEGEAKKAAARAMKLLLFKPRTTRELEDRLREEEFDEDDIAAAVAYCRSFGYVNDARYAENYVVSMKERKSHAMIRRELEGKGLDSSLIEAAFDEVPFEESDLAYDLVRKKCGSPHHMEEKELRRTFNFLARKGISSGTIWGAIRRYQNEAPFED